MAHYLHQPQLKYLYHDILLLSETAVGLQNQLFINELAPDTIKGGKHGTIFTSTSVEIFIP